MERLEQYCGRLLTADQLPAAYHELAQKMPAMTKPIPNTKRSPIFWKDKP